MNNKSKSRLKIEKIFNLMELFVEMIKNSLTFWLYFIKGMGFLTIYPALETLSLVSLDIYNHQRIKTLKNFMEKYNNTMRKRFFSLFVFFYLFYSTLFILLTLTAKPSACFNILKFILIISNNYLYIYMVTRPILKKQFTFIKLKPTVQVFLLLKEIKWTIVMIIGVSLAFYLSYKNFIFLIFVFPGLSGWFISWCMEKIIKAIMVKYNIQ